jgi:hypothetical protein
VVGNEIGLFWTFGLLVVASSGFSIRLWPSADPAILEHEHAPLQHEHFHIHDDHHQHEGWESPEPHRHVPQRDRLPSSNAPDQCISTAVPRAPARLARQTSTQ